MESKINNTADKIPNRLARKAKIEPRKIFFILPFILFALYALTMIAAFGVLLLNSLQSATDYQINIAYGKTFVFPEKLVFENYVYAFKEMSLEGGTNIFGMFFNSVWYVVTVAGGTVFFSACTGYALAKYKFKARGVFYACIIFTMTVPIVGNTGAMFKLIVDLKIYDTPLYPILINLSGTGMNFLIMYGFFRNLSWNYAEAAFIDGAGHWRVFLGIMLPMAAPAMGTLAILSVIGAWNEYLNVLLYLPSWPTMASGLYGLSQTLPRMGNTPVYYAALVITLIPMLVLFVAFSDKIMKNFTVGGLKG